VSGDRHAQQAEADLVREVAAGSEDALAALYDRHVDAVFAAAIRLTSDRQVAEEVVQETFLALWNRAELFNPAVGSLAAWLHTIARNRTVDRFRAAGRRPSLVSFSAASGADIDETAALERAIAGGTVLGGADLGPGPEGELATTELRDLLRGALAELPEQERTALVLAYSEELTQTEIADRLGWPLGTVKTRTRRALLRLREVLADEFGPAAELAPLPVPAGEASDR
jgi:RNA polymerase sigma-70 factor (ECF subfamily)